MASYAELHCLSNFTFLRGASHPEELAEQAHRLGYSALAITDECSLAGVVRAHRLVKPLGIKLIIGSEIQLEDGPKLVLLAQNRNGYGNLSQFITLGRRRAAKGGYRLEMADLQPGLPGCLALLIPDVAPVGYALRTLPTVNGAQCALYKDAIWLAERFPGRAWIAAELLLEQDPAAQLHHLRQLSQASGLPLTAAGDVHMHTRRRKIMQDTLTAIRLKTSVAQAGYALQRNAERHLRSRRKLARVYPPELLAETQAVAERCHFSLDELRYEYPEELVPQGETATSYLRHLTEEGLRRRFPRTASDVGRDKRSVPGGSAAVPGTAAPYPGLQQDGIPAKVREQIEYELSLIAELHYEPYFLTVHDIVRYARSRGILCQGRGSAANSAVCYCLGVTEVDPARGNLLFERFISRERGEPPDIDVDFEHERREEVIQYLYTKYGRDRAALAACVITYRPRSALRDVGKALGLELSQVDRVAKSIAWWDGPDDLQQRFVEAGLDPASPVVQRWAAIADELRGFPRHLSQHVGGFVISRGPLSRLVPVENAAMAERTVIQWDKNDLDTLGLLKVDVLALGMLSAIRRALELVSARRGRPFTLADIPPEDPAVYKMISAADTIGVFQVESRAQMAMLPRLKPRNFYDLVIEVSIVRPGPIQGGMVHPYLKRRQGLEKISYPSEAVKAVLERTLGVPIFQEQVMQLAVVAGGFTPGEADQLRRAMGAWRRQGQLEQFRLKLIDGMKARGYSDRFAQQIYRQIQGFGEYGFPESHAASFALLVYASAWLKRHEPAAFLAALLNSQPMGFYAPAQLIQDARRHGVEVLPVDVLASGWECGLGRVGMANRRDPPHENGGPCPPYTQMNARLAVRLGLCLVKGLSPDAGQRVVAARQAPPLRPGSAQALSREEPESTTPSFPPLTRGAGGVNGLEGFTDVDHLAQAAALDRCDLQALAAAGALQSIAGHRRNAYWQAAGLERHGGLLAGAPIQDALPGFEAPTEGQDIVADYASLGFTLGSHPLALLRPRLYRRGLQTAAKLRDLADGSRTTTAGLVTHRQRPGSASGVVFVTLEDETGYINVIVRPDLAERQRRELLGASLLGVAGVLERQGSVAHLLAERLYDYSGQLGRLRASSRDFR